jgi:type III pantothenate kinase
MNRLVNILVDIGNSRIKWALQSANELTNMQALPYQQSNLAELLTKAWGNLPKPKQVLIANVAGSQVKAICQAWLQQKWGIEGYFVSSEQRKFSVDNAYHQPEKLGVDRWLSLLAAYMSLKKAVCIIDCGTSITVDVVNSQGQHLGGLIAPGLTLMRKALAQGTAGCPQVNAALETAEGLSLGHNSEACIKRGTLMMAIAFIKRAAQQAHEQIGDELSCLISGGDAQLLLPYLTSNYQHHPDLVLQGLALYAEKVA